MPFASQAQPTKRKQRSLRSRNTGICWFRDQVGDYPDAALVAEYVKAAELKWGDDAEDNCSVLSDNAFLSGFLEVHCGDAVDTLDHGEDLTKSWLCAIADAPSQNSRQYLLESTDKNMLFIGSASPEGVSEVLKIATLLGVVDSLYEIGLNDQCLSSSTCFPWNFEVISADSNAAMRKKVAAALKKHKAAPEAWVASLHCVGKELNFALLAVMGDSLRSLHPNYSWVLETRKAGPESFLRTVFFWQDSTGSTNPFTQANKP